MKIIWMNGGLGNQLFQYIFLRYMEIKTGDFCYIDDRFFFQDKQHNGYEIERLFDIKANKLSEYFDAEVWDEIVESTKSDINVIDLLRSAGMDIELLSEGDSYAQRYVHLKQPYTGQMRTFPMNSYAPQVTDIVGHLYCHGYYLNAHWFYDIRDAIVRELTFPEITDATNLALKEALGRAESIAMHVRRGDFVTLGWALDPERLADGAALFKAQISNPVFYIFSDDPEWCKKNLSALGLTPKDQINFVTANKGLENYRDMQLMTYCDNLIISNSSFSYLAALLNCRPGKRVYNPTAREIM